jgi:GNAT superfamily N-acetyltransferase
MVELQFVPYNDEVHRDQFYELNLEYLTWVDNESYTRYGVNVNPDGSVQEYLDSVYQKFTEIEPPEGIIYILESEGKAVGMGALRKLQDGIGEIKRMYIRPNPIYRGKGYGKKMLYRLEEKAREFGISTLRLDTGGEWDNRSDTEDFTIYMEKRFKTENP